MLTPNDIVFSATTTITTAGGSGGTGSKPYSVLTRSNGGAGGNGRLAFEDGDSVIGGLAGAVIVPSEGDVGFYRGVFDATRFKGGGLSPGAQTEIFAVGPFNPDFEVPAQGDFLAAMPTEGAPGAGKVGMLIEMRGYQMGADALPDLATETDWYSIGWLKDTGVETLPEWNLGHPAYPGSPPPADDNALKPGSPHGGTGSGIDKLDGYEYVQIRISIYLPDTITVSDAGPLLDDWTIRYSSNQ
jgi:hypothetical protein